MKKPRLKSGKNVAKMIQKNSNKSVKPMKPKSLTIGSMYPVGKEHGDKPKGQMGDKSVYHNTPKKRKPK